MGSPIAGDKRFAVDSAEGMKLLMQRMPCEEGMDKLSTFKQDQCPTEDLFCQNQGQKKEENRMSEDVTGSPYRRHPDDDGNSGPFDIVRTESASVDPLKRWRAAIVVIDDPNTVNSEHQAALALNASRRFRYTLHLRKEEEKKQIIAKIRRHAQVIRAAYLLQSQITGTPKSIPTPMLTGDYDIGPEQLASMTRDHDFTAPQHFGGVRGLAEELNTNTERGVHGDESDVRGLAEELNTNTERGVHGDESDVLQRKNMLGSNTYPQKEERSILRFLLDACRDTTLIILMVAASASLALGIKTEGMKEGLCDGASIAMAVIIVIAVTEYSFK
ncbi:hypothetical protein RJ639_041237 [Escallonia herrerae]|uniref:Cation-transporting P-type ATPase N-terminal domain-containing protein n=1 Tax=Escallonia herrerae TaxID=1293975 RepID=A0AA88WJF4_9ASTE|nr:hypothetical protein RJ639_041237 [Escallonia herrerae]